MLYKKPLHYLKSLKSQNQFPSYPLKTYKICKNATHTVPLVSQLLHPKNKSIHLSQPRLVVPSGSLCPCPWDINVTMLPCLGGCLTLLSPMLPTRQVYWPLLRGSSHTPPWSFSVARWWRNRKVLSKWEQRPWHFFPNQIQRGILGWLAV